MNLSRNFFFILMISLFVPTVNHAQSIGNAGWNTFWRSFQTAVKNRNKSALRAMLSKESFVAAGGFISDSERDSFFSEIRRKEWAMMDAAIKKGIKRTDDTTKSTRGGLLIFRLENGKWYWSEVWFSGD